MTVEVPHEYTPSKFFTIFIIRLAQVLQNLVKTDEKCNVLRLEMACKYCT